MNFISGWLAQSSLTHTHVKYSCFVVLIRLGAHSLEFLFCKVCANCYIAASDNTFVISLICNQKPSEM